MKYLRELYPQEMALLVRLLQGKPESLHFIDQLNGLKVAEMSDGGMGSLSLVPQNLQGMSRSFGRQLVLGEYTDSDGISISFAVNVDSQGQLFELDVWKVNFTPLLAWPDPCDIRIVG
jgi:hypothetical protein